MHEERKLRDRQVGMGSGGTMAARHQSRRGPRCYFCQKFGHIKRYCKEYEEQLNQVEREEGGKERGQSESEQGRSDAKRLQQFWK